MDITPSIPGNRTMVTSYGPGRFSISHQEQTGSMLLAPESFASWNVDTMEELSIESFSWFLDHENPVEIIIIGCGPRMQLIPSAIKKALKEKGISLEPMETGAACRTFNILMSEGRNAGAALIQLPDA